MADTEAIMKQATKLGEMIAEHESAQRVEAATKRLREDSDAQQALQAFNEFLQKLAQKEASGQAIEVEEKRKLEGLQNAIVHSITLRNLQMAQMDYVDLIRKVNDTVYGKAPDAGGPAGEAAPGPGAGPAGMGPILS